MTQSLSCHKKDADACSHKHSEGNLPYSNIVNEKMLLFIFSICILVKILLFVTSSILIYHANVVCRTFEENALLHNKVRQNTLTLSCTLSPQVVNLFSGYHNYKMLHKNVVFENNLFGDNKTSM